MTLRVRLPFLLMFLLTLLILGAAAYAYYSDYFILKTIEVSPEEYRTSLNKTRLRPGQNMFFLPIDESLTFMCDSRSVLKVELQYDLPNAVSINVNNIRPMALAFGDDNESILGIDHNCRVIPFDRKDRSIPYPFVTGLENLRLYESVTDSNFTLLMEQLCLLKSTAGEIYESISSLELAAEDSVTIYIDGITFPVITYPGRLNDNLSKLNYFLAGIKLELKEVIYIDLRSNDQIIAKRKECPKQES